MARYGMAIDINKCNGCYNCFLACKDEFTGNDHPPLSVAQPQAAEPWLKVREIERGVCPKVKVDYVPVPCQQCRRPACIENSPEGAVYRRPDGIVIIDPIKAQGCKEIVSSCPHRLIVWNEDKQVAQKCTFCAHLLDLGWQTPRCVEACPSGALVFGDLDDPESAVYQLEARSDAEELSPEFDLEPDVFYFGLPKTMITGEVLLADKPDVCAGDVTVELMNGGDTRIAMTNYLGDFVFDGLEEKQTYTLRIAHPGYASREIAVKTYTDTDMGEIVLQPE
jgi:Fe-S-cluster-containing dehydrogenase component